MEKKLNELLLQSYLKEDILEKETLIKKKLTQTLNIVKKIREIKVRSNKQDISENLFELQSDFEELVTKRNKLETNIMFTHQIIENKLIKIISNIDFYAQSKDDLKFVLQEAILQMKEACNADLFLLYYNYLENNLQCIICFEIFIKATSVNCGHIFCKKCITTWNIQKETCPICRKPISTKVNLISLDNYIDHLFDAFFLEKKKLRQLLKASHAEDICAMNVFRNKGSQNGNQTSSVSFDDEVIIILPSQTQSEIGDNYVNSPRRRYGTCFVCGNSSHWAIECPRRRSSRSG